MKKTILFLFVFVLSLNLFSQVQIEWQKCLGGTDDDSAKSIIQTFDGRNNIAGLSNSNDFDVSGNHGSKDFWVVKMDS